MIHVVNMIPFSLSGESSQDSEPNLAVNPAKPSDMVGTAFTKAPMGGSFAPIYISTDGGNTWSLRTVVPGNGPFGTSDITVGFATTSGVLYAGTLHGTTLHLQILRTAAFTSTTPMTVLVDRANEDQPWVVAGSVVVGKASRDRVYVGNNDFNQPSGHTATVDLSLDARTAAAPAGFAPHSVERRTTIGQDGPPVRVALHADGTVYAVHERWVSGGVPNITMDVVVSRDDNWGSGANPFSALVDSGDGKIGKRVVTGRFIKWNATMGQERLGGDLSIAVDPTNSSVVYIAWCDRVGGVADTDWTLHVRRSTNRGQTWSNDIRTITNAKNPSLAVDGKGRLGLVVQRFTGSRWVTQLELTTNAWSTRQRSSCSTRRICRPGPDVPPLPRRLHSAAGGGDGLPRGLLWEQHPRQRELPERGRLPTGGELHDAHAVPHGRRDTGRPVDRSVLLPLDGQADHP